MNKVLKKILKIILLILIIFLIFVLIVFLGHNIKTSNEYEELNSAGYINKYSAGNYELNIYRVGNKDSKHKIIGISGLGVNNFAIEMSLVNKKLMNDYEFIYIDRAGYGYSDDTSEEQTVDKIVLDYKTALKNAGIEGPYILMPHSLGGVYATYWESMYPDEIKGVILIDTSEIGIDIRDEEDYSIGLSDYIELLGSDLGFQRFVLRDNFYYLPSYYPKKYQKISDYLNIYSAATKAKISEIKEINNNTNKTYNSIKSNDIPKIYINASRGYRSVNEVRNTILWMNERQIENNIEVTSMPSNAKLKKVIEQSINIENERIKPYIDLLGNTEIVLLAGDHMIFEQRPDDLADIIKDFVNGLD